MKTIIFTAFCLLGAFFCIPSLIVFKSRPVQATYAASQQTVIELAKKSNKEVDKHIPVARYSDKHKRLYRPFILVIENPNPKPIQFEIVCGTANGQVHSLIPGNKKITLDMPEIKGNAEIKDNPEIFSIGLPGWSRDCKITSSKDNIVER